MNVLDLIAKVWGLPQPSRDKVLQLIGLVAELTQDPNVRALLDSLKPKP